MRKGVWTVGFVAVLALLLGACGVRGGRDAAGPEPITTTAPAATTTTEVPASRAAYSVAINQELSVLLDQDDRCVSGRLVDAVGLERLRAGRVEPADAFTAELFTAIHASGADRLALERAAADALRVCGTSTKLETGWMTLDGVELDVAPFVPCAAAGLTPRLAKITMDAWAGMSRSTATLEVTGAIAVSSDECPDYQVAVNQAFARDAGGELSPRQLSCLRDRYGDLADRHQEISSQDHRSAIEACS